MRRAGAIAVGFIGFLALLLAATAWLMPRIEDDLTTRAEQELAASGIDDVSVDFDGRNGSLEGLRGADAEAELGSLRGARWVRAEPPPPTIPTTTTTIATTTTTAPPPQPATVSISRNGRTVLLAGAVQTEDQRRSLVNQVTAAGFDVDDTMTVDPEVDGGVEGLAPLVRPVLDGSDDGELDFIDGTVTLTGTAYDPVEAEEIDAAVDQATQAGLEVDNRFTTRELPEDVQIVALQEEIDQIFELARAIEGQNPSFAISDEELSPQATDILDRVIVAMRRYPLPWADITGHTDAQGSAESNLVLSETRAASVMDYLTTGGVDQGRLTAVGRGESEPIADNGTEEGRAQNRRVDFVVRKSEG